MYFLTYMGNFFNTICSKGIHMALNITNPAPEIVKIFGKVCELDSPQVCLYWVTDVYWGLGPSPAGVVVAAPMLGIVARVYILHSLITVAIIPGASPGQRKN